jgi:hypothetical protein
MKEYSRNSKHTVKLSFKEKNNEKATKCTDSVLEHFTLFIQFLKQILVVVYIEGCVCVCVCVCVW